MIYSHRRFFLSSLYPLLLFVLSSCASAPTIQPQINSLTIAEKFTPAIKIMEENKLSYGPNNELLYYMDYGLVLHYAGRYEQSIAAFEEAKKRYDDLYTRSVVKGISTWLVNDYMSTYRGEDFERVMINVFQAVNYALLGNLEEALVDARDVDSKLELFNAQYAPDQKNVYKEDAFVRMLMGIFYEAEGSRQALEDAYLSYKKAAEIYDNDYSANYRAFTPVVLQENLLSLAKAIRPEEFNFYHQKYGAEKILSLEDKKNKAQVYLIHYQGLSPIKHEGGLPIPLPNGYLSQLSFPRYSERDYDGELGIFKARKHGAPFVESLEELGENITLIAAHNLQNRQFRVIAKAALRSGGKLAFEQFQGENIKRAYGEDASIAFQYLSSLYNLTSERADLRSWQTLPGEIRIARLILEPGEYQFFYDHRTLKTLVLSAGDVKFLTLRTSN